MVRLPPYFLARWAHRWHGLCALCHEPLKISVRSQGLAVNLAKSSVHATLCQTCHALMAWRLPPVRLKIGSEMAQYIQLYFATFYQYPINQALGQFKDDESLSAFMILLHAIFQLPKPTGAHANNTVILPIPTTAKRLAKRGFDPAMLLARSLAHHWQLPIWQGLRRVDDVEHQRRLGRQERLDNMKNAFEMNDLPPVRQIILFDDVATTGATLQMAASAILRHAPKVSILAVCVAHGSDDFSQLNQ